MTLYEFNALNDFDKGEFLFKNGEHLSERFDKDYGYSLYELNNFYAEVQYNGGINAITKFISFCTYTGEPSDSDSDYKFKVKRLLDTSTDTFTKILR